MDKSLTWYDVNNMRSVYVSLPSVVALYPSPHREKGGGVVRTLFTLVTPPELSDKLLCKLS